jgi:hypothetical protein
MSTDVSEVRAASIITALMMEAVRTSETSVNIYLTTQQAVYLRSTLLFYTNYKLVNIHPNIKTGQMFTYYRRFQGPLRGRHQQEIDHTKANGNVRQKNE